jgi:hypothetical protein
MQHFANLFVQQLRLVPGIAWAVIWIAMVAPLAAEDSSTGGTTEIRLTSWDQAATGGWVLRDRDHENHDGQIGLREGRLWMHDDRDAMPDWAEMALPREISVAESFALEFRGRFARLGLSDEGTGHKSLFRVLLGVKSPAGEYGLNLSFTHDRYNLEALTKVIRIDDQWHVWRLEIDTRRHFVSLFRDGEYVCLHEASGRQAPGIRLQLQGSAEKPAEVEIADLSITPLPQRLAASLLKAPDRQAELRPGDWPLWRRDRGNSGVSPLSGRMTGAPQVAWSIGVGSTAVTPQWLDLDGDGRMEAVVSHGGNLSAWRLDGTRLWQQRLENATVFGLHDLDDDGQRELVIAAGTPPQVHVLRPKDGTVRYVCPEFPLAGVAAIRVAKLNPDLKGLQAVVWSSLHEVGFCLSFAEGVEQARLVWTFDWKKRFFFPTVAMADMDLDGDLDLVVATYSHVFVFDGRSGKPVMDLEWNSGRNYGTLVVEDVDGDRYPDVIVLAAVLREHIAVLHNDAGRSLRLLWDRFYEQNYPQDFVALRVLTNAVKDFDRDGHADVAYSVWDERIDRRWRTLVVDALSGEVKSELLDRYLVGVGEIGPDRSEVLFLSQPAGRTELGLDQISVWSFAGSAWREHSKLPPGKPILSVSALEFPLNAWSQESGIKNSEPSRILRPLAGPDSPSGVFIERQDPPRVEFLAYQPAAGWQQQSTWPLPREQEATLLSFVLAAPSEKLPWAILQTAEGAIVARDAENRAVGGFQPQTGVLTVPVAARLKPREASAILFFDPSGNLQCYRAGAEHKSPQKSWSHPAVGMWSLYTPLSQPRGIATISNVDLDDDLEVLVADKPDRLVALDPQGNVKRDWHFPALPQQWIVANFDGDEFPDLFVTYPVGAIIDVDSVAVAGRDGHMLWKSHCGNGPSAIADVNGDGYDDVVLRDLYERRILDGRSGRDLQPILMTAGYHTPLVPPRNTERRYPGVLWGGGGWSIGCENPAGQTRWWHWLTPNGTAGLADLGKGDFCAGCLTVGQIYQLPELLALPSPNMEFQAYDLSSGTLLWTHALGSTTSGIISADVDGDGAAEFLLGTGDGRLTALSTQPIQNPSGHVLWETALPGALGVPIVCDLDGDGAMEIVVSCADGRLYGLSASASKP